MQFSKATLYVLMRNGVARATLFLDRLRSMREAREDMDEVNKYVTPLLLGLVLFVLAGCSGMGNIANKGSAAPAGSIPVQITETEFHIASFVTSFIPGKTYHFVVANQGKLMHEFMVMPKAEGSMSGISMGSIDKLAPASIPMIDPGKTQTLNSTFPTSLAGSHPEFAC